MAKSPSKRIGRAGRGLGDRRAADDARQHAKTREDNASEIAEDYVEAIADLIDGAGEARAVHLARRLGVSHVTVVRTIARLQRDDFVSAKPYRSIFLTEKGQRLAAACRRRHEVVLAFLQAIGVSAATARLDAEGIEHHVSPETLAAFENHVRSRRP